MSEKRVRDIVDLTILNPLTLLTKLDEIIIGSLPDRYRGAAEHYLNAKLEMLKAIGELINIRIEEIKELRDNLREKEIKKEKVDIE